MKKCLPTIVLTVLLAINICGRVSIAANDILAHLQVGKQITVYPDQASGAYFYKLKRKIFP